MNISIAQYSTSASGEADVFSRLARAAFALSALTAIIAMTLAASSAYAADEISVESARVRTHAPAVRLPIQRSLPAVSKRSEIADRVAGQNPKTK